VGILVGDALLTEAFAWLARPLVGTSIEPARHLRAIAEVARRSTHGHDRRPGRGHVAERSHEQSTDHDALVRSCTSSTATRPGSSSPRSSSADSSAARPTNSSRPCAAVRTRSASPSDRR
jgi:hypothetical protein